MRRGGGGGGGGGGLGDTAAAAAALEYMASQSEWVPDSSVSRCQSCGGGFSLGNRKHHCRRCGSLVCASCSEARIRMCGLDQCRVCDACRGEMARLRDFERTHGARMTGNLALLNGSESFSVFAGGAPAAVAEVWLSGDLLLVCWRTLGGELEGRPVHLLERVERGVQTTELRLRQRKKSACCESEDAEFLALAPCLFSLVFRDGSTLDLAAEAPRAADEWARRFVALAAAVGPFARHRHEHGGMRVPALLRKEHVRLRQLADHRTRAERKARTTQQRRRRSTAIRQKYERIRDP